MIFNLASSKRYIEIIFKFLSILFKRDVLHFITTNLLGIMSRIMTIVAFFFSVKVAGLIYQETLLSVLDSFDIEWLQAFTLQEATIAVTSLAFLMFLMSGFLPFIYVKVIRNYAYVNALVFRKNNTIKFLNSFSSIPDDEKRNMLRLYLFSLDQRYTRNVINIIKYLFEMIQTFVVLCVCVTFLMYMYPANGLYFSLLLLCLIIIYVKINWKLSKLQKNNESVYFNTIKKRKTDILNHKEMEVVSSSFADSFSSVQGSEIEKKYVFSITSNEIQVRKIQLILQIILGLFFTYVILMLSNSEKHSIDFTKLVISFLLIRFTFGVIQNFISSIKNVNRDYDILRQK